MLQNLTRRHALLWTAAGLIPLPAASADPLRVALVLPTPIGDAGWSWQHERGRREMDAALGDAVRSTVVESVAEGPDAERVMRDLAQRGHGLVLAASFGYLEPALRVAADFPAVRFEVCGGFKTAANLGDYNARVYEARYLAGLLAGQATRSGVAGFVAGFPVPEVVQGINAFALGLRRANPKAEVRVLWANTWFDPPREREAAQTLVNQGADVLTHHTGSPAVAQLAEELTRQGRAVRVIPYQGNGRLWAPTAQLATVVARWGGYYTRTARAVIGGTWKPGDTWGGLGQGMVALDGLDPALSAPHRAALEALQQQVAAGKVRPFDAPLTDQAGHVRLASGTLGDAQIGPMNWFVRGVVGSLPS